ncbi:MAG: hypothetical protein FDZ75_06035 [Actinobacteria bacterium]|nr:MAG: hypothetical protein FDZ75_06035 [Actinomycetota bacterium]
MGPAACFSAAWRAAAARQRVEDALKFLFDRDQEGRRASPEALAGTLRLNEAATLVLIERLEGLGLASHARRDLELTPDGRRAALQIVRAHRLWERYLADEARMPLEQVHAVAHRREHGMSAAEIDALDASLGHPARDPHGDPIPSAEGDLRWKAGENGTAQPLTALTVGASGRIVHLEDEPPLAYAQLLADGLRVGQSLTVLEVRAERIVVTDGEREIVTAPAIAANVLLQADAAADALPPGTLPLSRLSGQAAAEIVALDERCQGFTRRRFLDLGLTPGTRIAPELANAFGEPRAYRVRGTLIALRNDQAEMIWVREEG